MSKTVGERKVDFCFLIFLYEKALYRIDNN